MKHFIYNLACTSWHESCLSLETTGCSLKRLNRFENSTKLPLPKCFLISLHFFFALDAM